MPTHAPAPGRADPLDVHGVVPPTVTAFHDDGTLDPATTAAHARFVVDRGANAVMSLGTNGEFALLDAGERDRVVEAVVDEVGGDVPVLAGVGEPGTHGTVERAGNAVAAGADGVVVVTPYYYPLDHDAAVGHYRAVADAVDAPVYVYHIPSRTGNSLSVETMAAVADLDGVVGLKDSSKDVAWLGQVLDARPGLTYLAGSDSLLVPGLDLGCAGVVSAVANAFPKLVVDLYEAYDAGDDDRARALQRRIYGVRRALKQGPYLAGVKAALSLRGFDAGPLRSPLRSMDHEERAALETELADLDLL